MTRGRALVALVCVLAVLVVAQTLVARAKVAALRDTIEVYETQGVVSASTLAGALVREKVVFELANTRCEGLTECRPTKPVTVEPCDGGLCVSHDWSGRKQVAVVDGEAAGVPRAGDFSCDGADNGDDYRWRFTFTPTRAAFDPGTGTWFVTEFDARLEAVKDDAAACGEVTTVWEVTGEPV
ncbi:hypothetical protein FDA94_33450 [Herbidospora galbida]|uniref:Uncharacterized protein n=1 Tax=Herbidospora galbida TaxID=2575442 RepID=A0A4V5UXY9_9ACTN|nr:hypothetical protein [Herbidospora galbida]TKK81283.1 hypothetical protein FDA94_33450 [Herbidospora galbida]